MNLLVEGNCKTLNFKLKSKILQIHDILGKKCLKSRKDNFFTPLCCAEQDLKRAQFHVLVSSGRFFKLRLF